MTLTVRRSAMHQLTSTTFALGILLPDAEARAEDSVQQDEIIVAVGRPIITGAEAITYLDIPFAATRPKG